MEEAGRLALDWAVTVDASVLLAVESATVRASVAVVDKDSRVLAEASSEGARHHSETLLPLIDSVLSEARLSLEDLAGIAVSTGPGAFTSLRIGVATVKGLCFGEGPPVVAVPTLAALALTGHEAIGDLPGRCLIPTLDARREEVYAAGYIAGQASDARLQRILEASVFRSEELAAVLPQGGCLVGEGAEVVREGLQKHAPGLFDAATGAACQPEARSVGRLGWQALRAGEQMDASGLIPRYVRRAEAEVQRTAQRFE